MSLFLGCNKTTEPNTATNPLVGQYNFSTNFQKTSPDNPATLDKKEIFTGTIELKADGTFFISGTDKQQWPWQNEPQSRHEEEQGTWQVQENIVSFTSPNIKEGGWSFSGDFQFFIFQTLEETSKKVGSGNLQYHLLEQESQNKKDTAVKYILLINPYFIKKENL